MRCDIVGTWPLSFRRYNLSGRGLSVRWLKSQSRSPLLEILGFDDVPSIDRHGFRTRLHIHRNPELGQTES